MDNKIEEMCGHAIAVLMKGDHGTAVQMFEQILKEDPKLSIAWNNRGLALLSLGHPFDAVMNIDKAIECEPKEASYYNNKGAALYEMEELDKAIACYEDAIRLFPRFPESWNNIGNAKKYKGDLEGAIEAYRNSVAGKPEYVDAHLHLAFALLHTGQYAEGWREFEWRWKSHQLPPRGLPQPMWDGSSLEGKKLLIYGEQGFGDVLQFIRYVPYIKEQFGGTIYAEVRQPLTRLTQTVDGIDRVFTMGEKLPDDIDWVIPVMSLPLVMGTTLENIPWRGPYFKADEHRTEMWTKDLNRLPPGLRVGICWAGLSRPGRPEADRVDQKRSSTLAAWAEPALVQGVSWVSLQKGAPQMQIKTPPVGMTIGDFTEELYDFWDTASLINRLDLVITVDTAVVHLAAALGKPTWLVSRWDGCWRWLGNRKDSPWYPSLRQYVQHKPNDWAGVMSEIAGDLRRFVMEHSIKAALPNEA